MNDVTPHIQKRFTVAQSCDSQLCSLLSGHTTSENRILTFAMTGLNALSIYLIKPTHNDFNLKWAFLKLCNPIKGLNIHT